MNVIDKNGNLLNRGDTVKIDPSSDSIKPLEFEIDDFQIVEQNGKPTYMICSKYGDFPSEFVEKVTKMDIIQNLLDDLQEKINTINDKETISFFKNRITEILNEYKK